jgi:hypothetical protein
MKSLDPGLRRGDSFKILTFGIVIPVQGVAGVSDCMRSACETVMA